MKKRRRKKKQIKIGIGYVLAVIAIALSLISWPYLKNGFRRTNGARIPPGAYCYGIDISSYQKEIAWDSLRIMTDARRRTTLSKLHAKDIKLVSFVMIKASEGESMKDRLFLQHWKDAGERGIRRGAYHFFRSSKDPARQAANFIHAVGRIRPEDLPPVLDIETLHKGCSKKTLNRNVLIWLETVENHYGRKPIIYSSAHFIRDILDEKITARYPIWVAHYGKEKPDSQKWSIWQFTDKGVVYGLEGFADINVSTEELLKSL